MEFLYLKAKKMYVRSYCSVVNLIFDSDFFKKLTVTFTSEVSRACETPHLEPHRILIGRSRLLRWL